MWMLLKERYIEYFNYILGIFFVFYVVNKYLEHNVAYAIVSGLNVFSVVILFAVMKKYLLIKYYKEYFFIFVALLFSALPFCVNNFLYGDDLWGYSNTIISMVGITLQRPFIDLYMNMLSFFSYETTHFVRSVFMILQYFFAISFYTYLRNKGFSLKIGMFLSILVSCNVLVIDFLGYLVLFPVILSNLYVFYAYINWKIYIVDKRKYIYLVIGVILFISSCMHYPIITPIIFGYILIDIIFEKISVFKVLWYIVMYSIGMILYLVITNLLLIIFNIPVSARATTISTYEELAFKIKWFIFDVIPSTLNHLLTCFCGNLFTTTNNLFYTVNFNNSNITTILIILFITCIVFICYKFISSKKYFYCCYMLLSLPMSFMFWLVLGESVILTYYTYPLCFCTGIIVISAIWYVLQKCKTKMQDKNALSRNIIVFMILAIIISSNVYSNNFWVKYNASGYDFIRNTIAANMNNNIENIHVYGKINPVYINTYAVMAVKLILKDMQLDCDNYKITSSDDDSILTGITYDEKEKLYVRLTDYQKKVFDENYIKSDKYPVYCLKNQKYTEKDLLDIKNMFVEGGFLPEKNDNTIIVDLNKGFVRYNKF